MEIYVCFSPEKYILARGLILQLITLTMTLEHYSCRQAHG